MLPKPYGVLAGVVSVLVALAVSGWGGYSYRDAQCRADEERARAEMADALALLAHRYAEADAAATDARSKARALADQRLKVAKDESDRLPDRACGWSADEHRLLSNHYCARFPSAAGCVPDQVRDPAGAARAE